MRYYYDREPEIVIGPYSTGGGATARGDVHVHLHLNISVDGRTVNVGSKEIDSQEGANKVAAAVVAFLGDLFNSDKKQERLEMRSEFALEED